MKTFSNFDLQSQDQYAEKPEEIAETGFTASGAGEYFRRYDYSETYFSEDREVLHGRTFPLKTVEIIPEDDETSLLYTFYTYAKE